jgi:UDP-N-acetylmuramoylalanine-D-glutamate ligase
MRTTRWSRDAPRGRAHADVLAARADADYALLAARRTASWLRAAASAAARYRALKITGMHNAANALARWRWARRRAAAGRDAAALETFPGLPHRAQWVADVAGVRYVDDSKGTNVGATIAAVAGMPGRWC